VCVFSRRRVAALLCVCVLLRVCVLLIFSFLVYCIYNCIYISVIIIHNNAVIRVK
jgi:hypothetical protein